MQVSLLTLTLTRGPMSLATMVSEPAGNGYLFYMGCCAWTRHYFFWNETCFLQILELIKQHLKS
jgi:hypothetical protein